MYIYIYTHIHTRVHTRVNDKLPLKTIEMLIARTLYIGFRGNAGVFINNRCSIFVVGLVNGTGWRRLLSIIYYRAVWDVGPPTHAHDRLIFSSETTTTTTCYRPVHNAHTTRRRMFVYRFDREFSDGFLVVTITISVGSKYVFRSTYRYNSTWAGGYSMSRHKATCSIRNYCQVSIISRLQVTKC